MCQSHVTKLGKLIGTEEKVDLTALVNAVCRACQLEIEFPHFNEEELEIPHPFSLWRSSEVVQKTLEIPHV